MICELTNKMISVLGYILKGETDPCMLRDSHSVADVITWSIMFVLFVPLLAWWVIPLRKLGVYDIEFTCDKKE